MSCIWDEYKNHASYFSLNGIFSVLGLLLLFYVIFYKFLYLWTKVEFGLFI